MINCAFVGIFLPFGRPLLGSIANPCFPRKQSTYFGHLFLDKFKHQKQREMVYFSQFFLLRLLSFLSISTCHRLSLLSSFYWYAFVECGLFIRMQPCLHHIALSLTPLSMIWQWNGACYKKD